MNVKEITFDEKIENEIELDATITDELREEGIVRDFIREIQSKRKEMGLTPKDKIRVIFGDEKLKQIIDKNQAQIKKQVIAEEIEFSAERALTIDKV